MFSILNRALSWAITSFGNKFCLKKRSRLIKANRLCVKFMQLEIGLLEFFCFWSEIDLNASFFQKSTASPFQTRKLPTLPLELDYPTLPGQEGGGIQSDIPG